MDQYIILTNDGNVYISSNTFSDIKNIEDIENQFVLIEGIQDLNIMDVGIGTIKSDGPNVGIDIVVKTYNNEEYILSSSFDLFEYTLNKII